MTAPNFKRYTSYFIMLVNHGKWRELCEKETKINRSLRYVFIGGTNCRGNLGGVVARALGDCFVSPHLPTGIASSPALLAKTVGVGRDCFAEFTLSEILRCAQNDKRRRAPSR